MMKGFQNIKEWNSTDRIWDSKMDLKEMLIGSHKLVNHPIEVTKYYTYI
jgi:hypothetical protein